MNELPSNSADVLEWDEVSPTPSTSNTPGVAEPVAEWHGGGGARGYSVISETIEESSSSVSAFTYIYVVWLLLLLLIAMAIFLVAMRHCSCCGSRSKNNEQHDMEVGQTSARPSINLRRRRIADIIGFTIMLIGAIVGWVLSIFSIATCQFVDLDPEISNLATYLDGNYLDRITITVYSVGMWSADVTSNSAIEGCVRNILPFLDWQFELARASAVIASLLGGQCLLILIVFALTPAFRARIRHLAWPFMLTALFQLMTLFLLSSGYCNDMLLGNGGCSVSLGGTASITAALYWMFMVFASASAPFHP